MTHRVQVVETPPEAASIVCVIGGDHHIHSHQYQNHIVDGVPNRIHQGIEVLREGYSRAVDLGVSFIINGDLMHNKNSIDPVVMSELSAFFSNAETTVIMIVGNHEKPDKFKSTSTLDAFKTYNNVLVVDKPKSLTIKGVKTMLVPFAYKHKELVQEVETILDGDTDHIFIGHYPTSGVNLGNFTLECTVKFEDFKPHLFKALLFNDIHKHQPVGQNGYHLGATMQNNFGEAEYDCGWWELYVLDDTFYIKRIPTTAPRFFYVDSDEEAESLREQGHYVRLKPSVQIKKNMAETKKARLEIDTKNLNNTIDNYLNYRTNEGKLDKSIVQDVKQAATEVLQ
jgi:DNA repair exonuclease SbcCD nuclease subunit